MYIRCTSSVECLLYVCKHGHTPWHQMFGCSLGASSFLGTGHTKHGDLSDLATDSPRIRNFAYCRWSYRSIERKGSLFYTLPLKEHLCRLLESSEGNSRLFFFFFTDRKEFRSKQIEYLALGNTPSFACHCVLQHGHFLRHQAYSRAQSSVLKISLLYGRGITTGCYHNKSASLNIFREETASPFALKSYMKVTFGGLF